MKPFQKKKRIGKDETLSHSLLYRFKRHYQGFHIILTPTVSTIKIR